MSATRFKIGDKVRVRKGLKVDHWYGNYLYSSFMTTLVDEVDTVTGVCGDGNAYLLNHYDIGWTDEMLEPAEKTLDNLRSGDMISDKDGDVRKVLAAVDGCFLLSYREDKDAASAWHTTTELKRYGYSPVKPSTPKPTVEINGKKYDKSEIEEAIKDLEPIE